jgi:hypothetical protein
VLKLFALNGGTWKELDGLTTVHEVMALKEWWYNII